MKSTFILQKAALRTIFKKEKRKSCKKIFQNISSIYIFESLMFFKQNEMKHFLKTIIVTLHLKTIENSKSQN